ncbi:MAG: sulfatase-like hydrolase/transferase [Bacteroidota bacterium]
MIITDDIGVDPMPGYTPNSGAQKAQMPNLQALADSGLTFDNVWANPLCSPSRAAMLTGKYGFRTGVLNPTDMARISRDENTLHAYLDSASNYAQSLIGKWHLGGGLNGNYDYPLDMGIDYFAGIMNGGVDDYFSWPLVQNSQESTDTTYITSKFTDLAIDWIQAQTQPWFCWLAYNSAHTPFHLPPPDMHSQVGLSGDSADVANNPLPYYLAMVESLDHELGRLLDSIPQSMIDNTVIIFVGDNGTPRQVVQNPYRRAESKGSLYEGGIAVPMIISGAGVDRKGEHEPALVSVVDLFPTIVEMSGVSAPSVNDGFSFYHLLSQAGSGTRNCAYAEIQQNTPESGYAVRDDTFKLIVFDSLAWEFYDLVADPYEDNELLTSGVPLTAAQTAAYQRLSTVFDDSATACIFPSSLNTSQEQSFREAGLQVYPNPVEDQLYIRSDLAAPIEAVIYDLQGRQIQTISLQPGKNELDLREWPSGIYVLVSEFGREKFVKY